MATTFANARKQMRILLQAAWDANTPAVTPDSSVPQLIQQGIEPETPPPNDKPYARMVIFHGVSFQATLADKDGNRTFERNGFITVQVFAPLDGTGLSLAENLATIGNNAFEGKSINPEQIWFRNVRINEIGPSGPWYQINVIADFVYDEIK